jgi:hypothetical protein
LTPSLAAKPIALLAVADLARWRILTIGAEDAPLSIRLTCGYGFRARAFGASRNDEVVRERKGVRQCFRYPDVRASARGTV